MARPVDLGFQQHHFHGGRFGLVQVFEFGDFVLPPDPKDGMKCLHMKLLQLLDVMAVESPGLTAVEQ